MLNLVQHPFFKRWIDFVRLRLAPAPAFAGMT
jgi:hypothetical protein